VQYTAGTALHLRRLNSDYIADAGDWSWNVLLPLVCYAGLLLAGLMMSVHVALALYLTAAVTVMLLFTGIHNAWDIAVWFTAERPGARDDPSKKTPPGEPPAK
jgi:hypothetical protein